MRSVRSVVVAVGLVAGGLVTGGSVALLGSATVASAAPVKSCTPSQIAVSVGAAQGTAGTTYIPIVFTNKAATCAIWGVPSIQPVRGASHVAVGPPALSLSMGQMPVRQQLRKSHSVSVAFGVKESGNFTPSSCVARAATGVIVQLGSFVHPTYLHLPITVCSKHSSTTTKLIVPGVTGA